MTKYSSYDDMLKAHGEIIDIVYAGSYQGDIVCLLKRGPHYGHIILGYGSCSYCDSLEAAWGDDKELEALAKSIGNDITWLAPGEMLGYIDESISNKLRWHAHDPEIVEALRKQMELIT